MRMRDTITIAQFGTYVITAVYDYRVEVTYTNKHAPVSVDDIRIEEIELVVKTGPRVIRRVPSREIQPWLWEMLTDPDTLMALRLEDHQEEPSDERTDT